MRLLRDSHQQFFSPLNKKLLNIIYHPSSESPSLFTQKITTNYPLRKEASTLTNPSSSSKTLYPTSPTLHNPSTNDHLQKPNSSHSSLKHPSPHTKFVNPTSVTQCSKNQPFWHSLTHSLTHSLFPFPSPPLPTQTPPSHKSTYPYLS